MNKKQKKHVCDARFRGRKGMLFYGRKNHKNELTILYLRGKLINGEDKNSIILHIGGMEK